MKNHTLSRYAFWGTVLVIVCMFVGGMFFPIITALAQENPDPSQPGGLVPCGQDTDGDGVLSESEECTFADLVRLGQKIIEWLLYIGVFFAGVLFAYAGFLYVTSAGDSGKVEQAHRIFRNVAIGFILALAAWLIVYLITSTFLEDQTIPLLEDPGA